MAKHTFSKYALGITAAAMMTIPAAGIAGATSISPNGSTSDSGSNNISTLTDTTTPAPVSAEVTLDEVTLDEPAQEDPAPAEENSAFTDNPTPRDAETFEEISRATYDGEGWGLCNAGSTLIMSDGTAKLRHLDPVTFEEVQPRTKVTLNGSAVDKLNELECVDGAVYANIWMSNDILKINPESGIVTAVIDTTNLNHVASANPDAVLNGIAHIPDTDEFWVTGKLWDTLYHVRFD